MSEAQRLADELDDWSEGPYTWELTSKADALLRRQEALIERQHELLKQALEALEKAQHAMQADMGQDQIDEAITAIRAHLKDKQ